MTNASTTTAPVADARIVAWAAKSLGSNVPHPARVSCTVVACLKQAGATMVSKGLGDRYMVVGRSSVVDLAISFVDGGWAVSIAPRVACVKVSRAA